MLRKVGFSLVLAAAVAFSAGTANAAFIALVDTGGGNFDVVYDPQGSSGIGSMDFGITTDTAVSSITGTWTDNLNFTVDGATNRPAGDGNCGANACVTYGGVSFAGDLPTPGPVVVATLSVVDLGAANIVTTGSVGGAPTIFSNSAGGIPDNTENPLFSGGGTVPEPATLVLVGMGLAGMAFLRRRSA